MRDPGRVLAYLAIIRTVQAGRRAKQLEDRTGVNAPDGFPGGTDNQIEIRSPAQVRDGQRRTELVEHLRITRHVRARLVNRAVVNDRARGRSAIDLNAASECVAARAGPRRA